MTTETLDAAISSVMRMLRSISREALSKRETLIPQFAVICTVHPIEGKPFTTGKFGAVIVLPMNWGSAESADAGKDQVALTVRAIALAGRADAVVATYDAFVAYQDTSEPLGTTPVRDRPGRKEALVTTIERRDRSTSTMIKAPYVWDQGDVLFEPDDVVEGVRLGGRFADFLSPAPPHADNDARAYLKMAGHQIHIEEI